MPICTGRRVFRRDEHGTVVALAHPRWPGCVQVAWSDGRREWVPRTELRVTG